MGKEVKGIHYFNGLFMKAEEFELEQNYHKQMHRLHNRYLHTFGIVWGLDIKKSEKPGALPSDVTVAEGMALNKVSEDGGELSKDIILNEDTDVSLVKYGAGKGIYVYISYNENFLKKDEKDTENTYRLEGAKLDTETDRSKIKENENIILGKVTLIDKAGTLTVDKIETEESGKSLRRYAGPSGKSLETDRITLAIAGVTSGFPTIEGKLLDPDNGILVNSAATSFSGALSVKGALNTGSNIRVPDNIGLILGTTNPVSLHNYNATPELWVEATNQASAALVIGTGFDNDKVVRMRYIPGTVGGVAGELRIGQDAKNVTNFTHGYTSLYTNGAERLRIDAAGNVTVQTGSLRIPANDTFLDFGSDTRQMINLWGNGPNAAYGIGIQGWTQYYRSAGNFAWYIGGTHSDVEMDPGAGGTAAFVIKRSSGNVGIGTPNPSARLHVTGTNPLIANLGDTTISQYSNLVFYTDSGNGQIWRAGSTYSAWGGTSALNIYNSSGAIAFHPNNTANSLYMASSGNVGIGTTSPSEKLTIQGDASAPYALNVGGISNARIKVRHLDGKDYQSGNLDSLYLQYGVNYHTILNAGGSTGNVGIGTNPADKLDVAGSLRILTGSNPIRFTAVWSGFPDTATNQAEIANDTGTYKTLMIVGNKSGGLGRRVSIWDRLEVNGSQKITGRLGTSGWDPDSGYPTGWGGGIHTWDIAVRGTGRAVSGWQTGGWDLAEKFGNYDDSLEPGDVVAADTDISERLIKSTEPYQDNLLGVISEKPGFLLGVSWEDPHYPVALGLAGRVKVKVNLEGGSIKNGDYLTSSSEQGYAMKAVKAGSVICVALESFDGSEGEMGKIVVFINPHWRGGH